MIINEKGPFEEYTKKERIELRSNFNEIRKSKQQDIL